MSDHPVYQEHLNAAVDRLELSIRAGIDEVRGDVRRSETEWRQRSYEMTNALHHVQVGQALQGQEITQIKSKIALVASGIATAVSAIFAGAAALAKDKLFG